MTKRQFLYALNKELACLAPEDRAESFEYYSEIIDDRIESGVPEREAVGALGDVKSVAENIISDMPVSKLVKSRFRSKRSSSPAKVVLIVIGGLIIVPIIIAIIASVFSVYVSFWVIAISLLVSALACAISGVCGVFLSALYTFTVGFAEGMWLLGASLVALGLVFPLFLLGKWLAIGTAWLVKKTFPGIVRWLVKGGR